MKWVSKQVSYSGELVNPELGTSIIQEENSQYFSMVFEDSIHNFFNRLHLDVRDPRSVIKESLMHVNGVHIAAALRRDDVVPEAKEMYALAGEFTNLGSEYMLGIQQGDVADELHFTLANSLFDQQIVRTRAYKGRISEVVKQIMLANKWDEKLLDIDECSNDDIWYQMGMTDAEFIKDVLAVNAVAHDADATPFAAYLTSDGKFHFKNLGKIWGDPQGKIKTKATFSLIPRDRNAGSPLKENTSEQSIGAEAAADMASGQLDPNSSIQVWKKIPRSYVDQHKNFLHGEYRLQMSTGEIEQQQISAHNFPSNMETKFNRVLRPLRLLPPEGKEVRSHSLNFLHNSRGVATKKAEEENLLGQRINRVWRHLSSDHYMAFMSEYCPHVHAGDLVAIGVVTTLTKSRRSVTHTDTYLVESSRHGWNRQSQSGESVLTLSRWGIGEK